VTRVVVVGNLRDPGLRELSGRPALIVTGDDYPPVRHLGANVVGMGTGALSVRDLGHAAIVVAAADGEQAGRTLAKNNRWRTALLVLLPGHAKAIRLRDAVAVAEREGKRVSIVELVATTCLELGVENGEVIGIPESGVRGFLAAPESSAPSVPTEGPGQPHPDAPPAHNSMVVPPDPPTEPESAEPEQPAKKPRKRSAKASEATE